MDFFEEIKCGKITLSKWKPIFSHFIHQLILLKIIAFTRLDLQTIFYKNKILTLEGMRFDEGMIAYRLNIIIRAYPQLITVDKVRLPFLYQFHAELVANSFIS
jgi:hypothetical protein